MGRNHTDTEEEEEASSSEQQNMPKSHPYPAIYVSGRARVHLGDQYYNDFRHTQSSAIPGEDRDPEQGDHLGPHADLDANELELQQISTSLYYPELHQRYESIHDKHGSTYEWVFEPSHCEQPPWDSFINWLNNGDGLYWISGKPGSGKSTLVKYLVDTLCEPNRHGQDGSTQAKLSGSITVLSYFFWEAGEALQRSLEGCLRALLWQILQDLDFRSRALQAFRPFAGASWTRKRLQDTLKAALEQNEHLLVLFLDGLDESCDSDDILDLLESLESIRDVKICVSSRPEQLFVDAFSKKSKMRVQDLNNADIDIVIKEKLINNPEIAKLAADDPQSLHDVVFLVKCKAEGVFLWVHLAIKSLLRGFRNRDTFEILIRRLEQLPDDIYDLYRHMWKRNSEDNVLYMEHAALYYALIICREYSLVEFCLATDDNLRKRCLDFGSMWNCETVDIETNCANATTWLNVRAGGLLEVSIGVDDAAGPPPFETKQSSLSNCLVKYNKHKVQFIHRTAHDFLVQTLEGKQLLTACSKSEEELARICFESHIISRGVLPGIQGLCVDAVVLTLHMMNCEQCRNRVQSLSWNEDFRRLCVQLHSKGLIVVDDSWVSWYQYPSRVPPGRINRSFPSSKYGFIDLCPLYLYFAHFDLAERQLDQLSCWQDPEYLSSLLPPLERGLVDPGPFGAFGPLQHKVDEAGVRLMTRLIQHGANFDRPITLTNGELISPFGIIAENIARLRGLSSRWAYLIEAGASLEAVCFPLCGACHHIWWSKSETLQLWGSYCASDMLMSSGTLEHAPLTGLNSRIRVIARCPDSGGEHSLFYAVSASDSEKLLRMVRNPYNHGRPMSLYNNSGPGVIEIIPDCDVRFTRDGYGYRETYWRNFHLLPELNLISTIMRRSKLLDSFAEALVCLGKSEDTIQKWATGEEARVIETGKMLNENLTRRWKKWVFGPGFEKLEDSPGFENVVV